MRRQTARWITLSLFLLAGCQSLPEIQAPANLRDPALQRLRGEPSIAVSLAGGGSKAAPVALGSLQGLVEADDLSEVDTISSVSGGGYAALYLYSRARDIATRDPLAPATMTAAFADCMPLRYGKMGLASDGVCPKPINNYVEGDHYRFQNYLRGYQSLLRQDFVYTSTSQNRGALNGSMAKHLGASLVSAIPHHVVNSLFDWKIRMSPTGKAYDRGIHRTWGRTGKICDSDACPRVPGGDSDPETGMTFGQLRSVIEASRATDCIKSANGVCRLPTWLINATAAGNPIRQYLDRAPYTLHDVFTFSPSGYGSDARKFRAWESDNPMEPKVTVPEATAAAAAFFDLMSSNSMSPPMRMLTSGGEHVLNLAWGHVYPNFDLTESEFRRRRAVHRMLPFPLYLFHHNNYGPDGIHVRLSDGGRAENLGAYSTLRAGATHLILVDAAEDGKATLADVCDLRAQLHALAKARPEVAWKDVELEGLQFRGATHSLAQWCDKKTRLDIVRKLEADGIEEGELIRHWPAPVLAGCVLAEQAAGRSCATADAAGNVTTRVFLIKPAITEDAYVRFVAWYQQDDVAQCFLKDTPPDSRKAAELGCDALAKQLLHAIGDRLPVEVQGFLVANYWFRIFPQHSTWRTTAHSSPFIFGAYRELTRHYMRYLEIDRNAAQPVCIRSTPRGASIASPTNGTAAPHEHPAWGMCAEAPGPIVGQQKTPPSGEVSVEAPDDGEPVPKR